MSGDSAGSAGMLGIRQAVHYQYAIVLLMHAGFERVPISRVHLQLPLMHQSIK